jgi:hypothetical protein
MPAYQHTTTYGKTKALSIFEAIFQWRNERGVFFQVSWNQKEEFRKRNREVSKADERQFWRCKYFSQGNGVVCVSYKSFETKSCTVHVQCNVQCNESAAKISTTLVLLQCRTRIAPASSYRKSRSFPLSSLLSLPFPFP